MKLTGKSSNLIGKNFVLKIGPRVDSYSYDNRVRIKLYPLHDGKDDTRMTYNPVTEVWTCDVEPSLIAGHEDYTALYVSTYLLNKNVADKGSLSISTLSSGNAYCTGRYSNRDIYVEEGSIAKLVIHLTFAKNWAEFVEGDTHYTVAVLKSSDGTVLKVDKQNFIMPLEEHNSTAGDSVWEISLLPNTATVELYTLSANTKDESCPIVSAAGDEYAYALKWKMRGVKNIHWYPSSSVPSPLPFIEGVVATLRVDGYRLWAGIKPDGTVCTYKDPQSYYDITAAESWTNIVYLAINRNGLHGIKVDGTVVTTDVNIKSVETSIDWVNLKQLACTQYGLVGLKNDGTIVTAGYDNVGEMSQPKSWTDIKKVCCMFRSVIGLKNDGTVLYAGNDYYGSSGCTSWSGMKDISSGSSNIAGIKADNTTIEYGPGWYGLYAINDWTDIKRIILSEECAVGIKTDGTIISVDNRGWVYPNMLEIPNIISWCSDGLSISFIDCHGKYYYTTLDIRTPAVGSPGDWVLKTS